MKKYLLFIILLSMSSGSFAKCISEEPQVLSDVMKILHCLESEIKNLKNEKIVVNTFPNLPKPTTSKKATIEKFSIELLSCKRMSTDVNCNLIITNLGNDAVFKFYLNRDNEFIDEKGRGKSKYSLSFIDMGNGKDYRKLYTKIPVEVLLTISNVPDDVTQFIRFAVGAVQNYRLLKFENVAIIK